MSYQRFLLDTHTFLWWVTRDTRLPERVQVIIADPENDIFFSAVSAWEIAIKAQLGQMTLAGNPAELIPERVTANRFLTLPIEIHHALHVGGLPLLHRDPFDRLLIAQAQLEELTILTADPAIARYDVAVAW